MAVVNFDGYADLTLARAIKLAEDEGTEAKLKELELRISFVRQEMETFRSWCDRADKLYYAEDVSAGGADLWADHPSATTLGRSHVSVNLPASYVDIPAALQSVEPIENMVALDTTEEAAKSASALERLYVAWKQQEDFDLKFHKAAVIKALYGRTASRIYWSDDQPDGKRPTVEIVEQPRNLYLGYRTDSYEKLEWAAYLMRYEPNTLAAEYGVGLSTIQSHDGFSVPYLMLETQIESGKRPWIDFKDAKIEVWDYWYRQPVWKNGKITRTDTVNIVFAGNVILRGPTVYKEYKGDLPYVPLFNTFVPGTPNGRSELYDVEQLIREKFEKITAGSQMITNAVAGDFWQLVGPDAPSRVPAGLKPVRNGIIAPGPGNRIETISPFIAQFQLEQYLGRIDRELAAISGLNDLLLGLAPAQVLSSSKAINALIANYESRLAMRRRLFFRWRRRTWELALSIWEAKDKKVAEIVKAGGGVLDIIDPSLSPRDDMETATRAANLVNAKLWSQRRAMDAVGVDDPETEQDLIREERTDSTMFPEDVQVMAQLLSVLQSLGLNAPQGAQEQAQAQMGSGQADLRRALGERTPDNTTGSQLPGDMGMAPPIPGAGLEGQAGAQPFAQGPEAVLAQNMIQGGKAKNRIMTQQKLGRR